MNSIGQLNKRIILGIHQSTEMIDEQKVMVGVLLFVSLLATVTHN